MPTGQQFFALPNQKAHIGIVEKVQKELCLVDRCVNLELKLNKKIKFLWVDSASNPADVNSKTNTDITMPPIFLYGPSLFWPITRLQSHCFATSQGRQFKEEEEFKFANSNKIKTNLAPSPLE